MNLKRLYRVLIECRGKYDQWHELRLKPAYDIKTVHARHFNIQKNQLRTELHDGFQCLFAI